MTTKAFYHPLNRALDLSNLTPTLYQEIISYHGQIKAGDRPVFTCLGNGEPMHVYRHSSGRYFIRHFKNGHQDDHRHAQPISAMSDEHRRQADYTLRAAVSHGLDAQLEVSTGNGTRLDVGVIGREQIGFEIQRSSLSLSHARSRATKSFKAGWKTAWVTDRVPDPGWADWVPTARFQVREGWSEFLPPPNSRHVVIGDYRLERDRSTKTGYRYFRTPKTVLLDELAYLMPVGQIVPVAVGTKGRVDLAFKGAASVIDACTYNGASNWNPVSTRATKEAAQYFSRECAQHPQSQTCSICPQQLLHPLSIRRGYCEGCRKVLELPSIPEGVKWAG